MPSGELVQIPGGRPKWWRPGYTTPKGNSYHVDEVAVSECPVSLLHGQADLRRAAELLTIDRCVKNGTGATMYGPDSGKWPAMWFDLVAIFNNYLNLEMIAEQKAREEERL